jgi:3-hydroxyisobutyrate dehydrogenase-like beta-hydroxyacid dehydrogenase
MTTSPPGGAAGRAVSVLGTGQLGSAVAAALLRAGARVTVWNRTPGTAQPLVGAGARVAPRAADAVAASPTTLVVVSTYPVSTRVLQDEPGVAEAAAGRTLVQLSTGSPAQARAAGAWAARSGARYLDGYPTAHARRIGEPDAALLYSGPQEVFDAERPLLAVLGAARWLGADTGLAKAAALSSGPLYHAVMVGMAHTAALADAAGLSRADLAAVVEPFLPTLTALLQDMTARIAGRAYAEPRTRVAKQVSSSRLVLETVRELGLRDELAALLAAEFARADERGHGSHDVAALFETARGRSEDPHSDTPDPTTGTAG